MKVEPSIKINKDTTICITGHRPKSLPWGYNENIKTCRQFKHDLKEIFLNYIKNGKTTFLSGMAEGFDMISTEILLSLRKKYKNIEIIAVIPCINQEIKWSKKQQRRYHRLLKKCNNQIILSQKYTPTCMNDRNKFLVDHSSFVIACFNGKPSGTQNTLKYAQSKNLKIEIINPNLYKK